MSAAYGQTVEALNGSGRPLSAIRRSRPEVPATNPHSPWWKRQTMKETRQCCLWGMPERHGLAQARPRQSRPRWRNTQDTREPCTNPIALPIDRRWAVIRRDRCFSLSGRLSESPRAPHGRFSVNANRRSARHNAESGRRGYAPRENRRVSRMPRFLAFLIIAVTAACLAMSASAAGSSGALPPLLQRDLDQYLRDRSRIEHISAISLSGASSGQISAWATPIMPPRAIRPRCTSGSFPDTSLTTTRIMPRLRRCSAAT